MSASRAGDEHAEGFADGVHQLSTGMRDVIYNLNANFVSHQGAPELAPQGRRSVPSDQQVEAVKRSGPRGRRTERWHCDIPDGKAEVRHGDQTGDLFAWIRSSGPSLTFPGLEQVGGDGDQNNQRTPTTRDGAAGEARITNPAAMRHLVAAEHADTHSAHGDVNVTGSVQRSGVRTVYLFTVSARDAHRDRVRQLSPAPLERGQFLAKAEGEKPGSPHKHTRYSHQTPTLCFSGAVQQHADRTPNSALNNARITPDDNRVTTARVFRTFLHRRMPCSLSGPARNRFQR